MTSPHTPELKENKKRIDKFPLISVIVPVFKVEEYLNRCIESIVNQTYKNLEIILVDDGSPDRCGEMCDEWAKKDDRIKVIHKENGGAADAKNAGLRIAEGDYIAFVDSDDSIAPKMYETLYELIVEYDADIADSLALKISSYDDIPSSVSNQYTVKQFSAEEALSELMNDRTIRQTPWNKLYKRKTIEGILFPNGRYIDDEFWTYRVIGNCKKYIFTDEVFYYYLQRGESAMGRRYSLKRLDAIDAFEERYNYCSVKYPNLKNKALLSVIGSCRFHYQMLCYNKEVDPDKKYRRELYAKIKSFDLSTIRKGYKGKQRVWIEAFLIAPELTSKIRNRFKIGW